MKKVVCFVALLALVACNNVALAADKKAGDNKKVFLEIKKEIKDTGFKLDYENKVTSDFGIITHITHDKICKDLSEEAAKRVRDWAKQTKDPIVWVMIRDGKIIEVTMSTGDWKLVDKEGRTIIWGTVWSQGAKHDINATTCAHCIAKRFVGRPASRKTLQKLESDLKSALKLQFSD
ncbi:MAG: hypothetical protein AAB340_02725 [Patescibacteria group bacterium]